MAAPLFSCFDVRLASEVSLGELTPADDPADSRPVVQVRLGPVPEALPGAAEASFGLQARGERALLAVPKTARFLITAGSEIVVEPLPQAPERNVRLFLLGSALGVLAYQRGLLPLHANAVVIDGVAHAFMGHSGAGKSTLAAHFARTGQRVLADDVCVVSFDAAGRPLAWPGLPRVKLWQDAADALGESTASLDRAVEGLEKFHLPIGAAQPAGPVPLARLYTLARGESAIVPLGGAEAMAAVIANSYRGMYARILGREAEHFRNCALLCRHVRSFAATRTWGFDVFAAEAARLEAHLRSP